MSDGALPANQSRAEPLFLSQHPKGHARGPQPRRHGYHGQGRGLGERGVLDAAILGRITPGVIKLCIFVTVNSVINRKPPPCTPPHPSSSRLFFFRIFNCVVNTEVFICPALLKSTLAAGAGVHLPRGCSFSAALLGRRVAIRARTRAPRPGF